MTITLSQQSTAVDNAARMIAAGELGAAALDAIRFLNEIVADDAVDIKHRLKAAIALKDAAGFAGYSSKTLEAKAGKPLAELSSADLRASVQGAMAELAKRATPAQTIEHAPSDSAAHSQLADLL